MRHNENVMYAPSRVSKRGNVQASVVREECHAYFIILKISWWCSILCLHERTLPLKNNGGAIQVERWCIVSANKKHWNLDAISARIDRLCQITQTNVEKTMYIWQLFKNAKFWKFKMAAAAILDYQNVNNFCIYWAFGWIWTAHTLA